MARKKFDPSTVKVTNINKYGEVFDPKTYKVPYEGNEHIYAALAEIVGRINAKCQK